MVTVCEGRDCGRTPQITPAKTKAIAEWGQSEAGRPLDIDRDIHA